MNIGMIVPWDIICGIGIYAEHLAQALRDAGHRVIVLAEFAAPEHRRCEQDDVDVIRCWNRHDNWNGLIANLQSLDLDLVCFQHEFAYTDNAHLWRHLIHQTHATGRPFVAFIHSVLTCNHPLLEVREIDGIMVANPAAREWFLRQGWPPEKVAWIPHACLLPQPLRPASPRGRLATSGLMYNLKGYASLLEAVTLLRQQRPVSLTIFGAISELTRGPSEEVVRQLKQEIAARGLQRHVGLLTGFPPERLLQTLLADHDILVLFYDPHPHMLSASAGLMLALSTARPVVCSSIPHFDGPPALLEATLRARSVRELADQIERLLSDEELYAEMSRRARDYALSRPFSALAEDYVAFFESILAGQQPEQPAPWADAQPLLGVVIVTRDQKEPLRRALQSIAAPDVPTVVCDEGSSDGTAELLAAEFPQVTYVRPPERGRNRAANVGVQHCPTRYVKFLEAEDLLLPGWYEEHLRRCREGCPLITCGAVTNHGPRLRLINADGVVYGSQLCVKRDLFLSVGGFDENGPQLPETDLVARLQACGIVEGQIGKVLVAKEGTTAL